VLDLKRLAVALRAMSKSDLEAMFRGLGELAGQAPAES
jgi:hypothetical protein